jgi:hypothetical protein
VYLESGEDLTEVIITAEAPPVRLAGFSIMPVAPEIESASILSWRPVLRLTTLPGQVLRGPKHVANLCFTVMNLPPSAFLPVHVIRVRARRADGLVVENTPTWGGSSRIVGIGCEPLLELMQEWHGPVLIIYGQPGSWYQIETKPILDGYPDSWQPAFPVEIPSANLWQTINLFTTNRTMFYRARQK